MYAQVVVASIPTLSPSGTTELHVTFAAWHQRPPSHNIYQAFFIFPPLHFIECEERREPRNDASLASSQGSPLAHNHVCALSSKVMCIRRESLWTMLRLVCFVLPTSFFYSPYTLFPIEQYNNTQSTHIMYASMKCNIIIYTHMLSWVN